MTPRGADIIVLGGGPAGAAFAIAARRAGAEVLLLQRQEAHGKVGEVIESSARVSLGELGLWESFLKRDYRHAPETLSCWGSGTLVVRSALSNVYGEGLLVDRSDFEAWLLEAARREGVAVQTSRRSARIVAEGKVAWETAQFSTPLIVDATGRGSCALGAPRERIDRMVGILTYVGPEAPLVADPRLLVEAAPNGWWYSAGLPGHQGVCAFMTDADLLPRSPSQRSAWLMLALGDAPNTRTRLGRAATEANWHVRPAESSRQLALDRPGRIAIGDAAAAYDPLSGQGVAMALAKGLALARALRSADAGAALSAYRQAEDKAWADYLRLRRTLYESEDRWAQRPFWRRRRR